MQSTSPLVAVCIADSGPRSIVLDAIRREGAVPRVLSVDDLYAACEMGGGTRLRWDILVYDLSPFDEMAIELLVSLKQRHPVLQALIYGTQAPGREELLSLALKLDGVFMKHQFDDGRDGLRLRAEMRAMIDRIATRRLHRLIALLVGDIPPRVDSLVSRVLERIRHAELFDSVTVEAVAEDLALTRRTVERDISNTPFPPPKELLRWLTLLFCLVMEGAWSDTGRRAPKHGYCGSQRLYRMRKSLLKDWAKPVGRNLAQEFDIAFIAFSRRCGVHAERILREHKGLRHGGLYGSS